MILITSGAFLNAEFSSLLGKLPPAFLPVGNKRLFEWQLADLAKLNDRIVLTVPEEFQLDSFDHKKLRAAQVSILPVPACMSLGQSVVYSINVERAGNEPVRILHGDTLCGPVDGFGDDMALGGSTDEFYSWAEYKIDDDGRPHFREGLLTGGSPRQVLTGYFTFSDGAELVRCISLAGMDFIGGFNHYAASRPFRVERSERWRDFGHIQTYFKSKARHTTERSFNTLDVNPRWIEKSSTDREKINAEAAWFEALPNSLKVATPQYIGRGTTSTGDPSYRLEYLYLNTLSELAVFGRLPTFSWVRIFQLSDDFLTQAKALSPLALAASAPRVLGEDYAIKTEKRLSKFASDSGFDIHATTALAGQPLPSLARIAEEIGALVGDADATDIGLLHGDFCFSNMFHDFRSAQLKVIDPRGRDFVGRLTPWGDIRYDIAKLMHSVWGRYDFLVSNHFELERHGETSFVLTFPKSGTEWQRIQRSFFELEFAGHSPSSEALCAMTIQLFLSMLPLHADAPHRQLGFVANALRLYNELN